MTAAMRESPCGVPRAHTAPRPGGDWCQGDDSGNNRWGRTGGRGLLRRPRNWPVFGPMVAGRHRVGFGPAAVLRLRRAPREVAGVGRARPVGKDSRGGLPFPTRGGRWRGACRGRPGPGGRWHPADASPSRGRVRRSPACAASTHPGWCGLSRVALGGALSRRWRRYPSWRAMRDRGVSAPGGHSSPGLPHSCDLTAALRFAAHPSIAAIGCPMPTCGCVAAKAWKEGADPPTAGERRSGKHPPIRPGRI